MNNLSKKHVIGMVSIAALILTGVNSIYTVDEGHIGIVKHFGEAKSQSNPGIHLKVPFVDEIVELEARTRKNVEDHPAATKEQMPVTAKVSVNWTINKSQALELYKKYGGLDQFEQRILDPRLRAAAKDAISQFTAEELIQNRNAAINIAKEQLLLSMQSFPVKFGFASN